MTDQIFDRDSVRTFVRQILASIERRQDALADAGSILSTTNLIEVGYIDSLALMELLERIEVVFGVYVDIADPLFYVTGLTIESFTAAISHALDIPGGEV